MRWIVKAKTGWLPRAIRTSLALELRERLSRVHDKPEEVAEEIVSGASVELSTREQVMPVLECLHGAMVSSELYRVARMDPDFFAVGVESKAVSA